VYMTHQVTDAVAKEITRAFMNKRLPEAFELLRQHGVNPNTTDFGGKGNRLMHSLALWGCLFDACTVLREEFGADPELVDKMGRTPLSTQIIFSCGRGDVHQAAQAIGARLDSPHTLLSIAEYGVYILTSPDKFNTIINGDLDIVRIVPMVHMFSKHGLYMTFVQQLLDRYPEHQSPLELDEDGRTLFECKGVRPELIELLRDAMDEPQQCALTIMMALHPRLGSDSPLRWLDKEMLRSFILPLTTTVRHTTIADFRRIKLDALIKAEGLTSIDARLKDEYLNEGGMFLPMLFRRSHFLNINRKVYNDEDYDADKEDEYTCKRLERRGVIFDEPYTPVYEARAREADAKCLSSEWK